MMDLQSVRLKVFSASPALGWPCAAGGFVAAARSVASAAMNSDERRQFAVPAATGEFDEIDLAYIDPADEDERRILILADHPELHEAIEAGLDEIHLYGTTINPELHIAMHEIVANQLWDDDPPEVWQTAKRLLNAGYERHEVLHMLASVNSDALYDALHDQKPADLDAMRAALAALPESWEHRRTDSGEQHHANRAERRAAARRHRR
jgi:hypothetical protein